MQESAEVIKKRAYNREKQRIWREQNRERSRATKRAWMRKKRGQEEHTFIPGEKKSPSIFDAGFMERPYNPPPVALCETCGRKYLVKLHCLWCNRRNATC